MCRGTDPRGASPYQGLLVATQVALRAKGRTVEPERTASY